MLALFSAVVPSARSADDATATDLKKMEGKWTAPSASGGKSTYTFKGKTLKIDTPSRTYDITITVDATAKRDKTIDFKIDDAPEDAKGKTSKGIYKFDGDDKLILCFRGEGDRPTKFEQSGFEQILVELSRLKQ
jgi:uncharacterized protein (TIGR03067 family)